MLEPVLDAACGSKAFWFDRNDDRARFMDVRREQHALKDSGNRSGVRQLVVDPDTVADFRAMPFPDESFFLVVFDPPHLKRAGPKSWMAAKYGKLGPNWRDDLRAGFAECFRVLRPGGTLVFKWNETQVPLREVLALTDEKPLFGHRSGKASGTHWVAFLKAPLPPVDDVTSLTGHQLRGVRLVPPDQSLVSEDVLAARVGVRLACTETELRNLQRLLAEAQRAEVRGQSALPAIYAGIDRVQRRQLQQAEALAASRRGGGDA